MEALGEVSARVKFTGSGPYPNRQAHSFGHSIYADSSDRFVYACDLGSDRVWTFHFDASKGLLQATDPPAGILPAGTGPRHLAFGASGAIVYVNGEMGRSVTAFQRDAKTGQLTPLQTCPWSRAQTPIPR